MQHKHTNNIASQYLSQLLGISSSAKYFMILGIKAKYVLR